MLKGSLRIMVMGMAVCGGLAACGARNETKTDARAAHRAANVAVDAISGATSHLTGRGAGRGLSRFDHVAHQKLGSTCEVCHHPGSGERSCTGGQGCHSSGSRAPVSSEVAFHSACQPCHRKAGLGNSCDLCHQASLPAEARE